MMSTWAAILATTAGCRYVLPSTMVPTRRRGTRVASALSVLHASSMAPSRSRVLGMKWSVTQAMSHPVASRCRQRSSTPDQVWLPMLVNRPKRMSLSSSVLPAGAGGVMSRGSLGSNAILSPSRPLEDRHCGGYPRGSLPCPGAMRFAALRGAWLEGDMMPSLLGKRAVVVGAGMGGLTAARALADHFEQVLVLERDPLPGHVADRASVPQGRHVHALLAGGQRALCALFPGFERDLARAAAVPMRAGLDVRTERPGYDPFPQRDLGWDAYAVSRAQLEFLVRERVQAVANVEIHPRCRVQEFVAREDGAAVTGVRCLSTERGERDRAGRSRRRRLGPGALTLDLLRSIGRALPHESAIGVDVGYASAVFAIPADAPRDWKGVFTFPGPPTAAAARYSCRWRGSAGSSPSRVGRERPPGDADGFMAFARQLRTPTISNAIERATRLGEIARAPVPGERVPAL